jgi:Fe2+ transport system protein B
MESQTLRLAVAEMVASKIRLASHIDVRLLHPFTGPALFTAARVLMRSLTVRTDDNQQRSLEVLVNAMGDPVNGLNKKYWL